MTVTHVLPFVWALKQAKSQQRSNQKHSFENGLPSLSRNFVPIQFYSSAVINIIFSSMYHGLCMFLPATVAGPNVQSVRGWQAVTFLSPFLNIDPWGLCSMPYYRTKVVTTEPSPTNTDLHSAPHLLTLGWKSFCNCVWEVKLLWNEGEGKRKDKTHETFSILLNIFLLIIHLLRMC